MFFDINRMIMESLSINDCLFIYFCQIKDIENFNYYREQFGSLITKQRLFELIERGYIEYVDENNKSLTFGNLNPTNKASFILGEIKPKPKEPEKPVNSLDWMEEWYALFPKGVKSGGYLVRSGLNTCRAKMFKFLKRNKFSKETIITATRLYLKEMEKVNNSYIQLAKYFIEKEGSSTLESFCEQVEERLANGENLDIELNKGYSDGFSTALN